jgi:hypothetical protein
MVFRAALAALVAFLAGAAPAGAAASPRAWVSPRRWATATTGPI